MLFKLGLWWRRLKSKLWLRPALASLFSMSVAGFALWFGRSYDGRFDIEIDENSLVSLLTIFASSMLSVATFTVSAIVTAASSVSKSTTPRASQFVLSDSKAQLVLSAFIATFIYAIVGILSLRALHFGHAGRFVLFMGLIVIVTFVLIAFINWVDHAIKLGRQGTIISKLSEAALNTMTPEIVGTFGAHSWDGEIPNDCQALYPASYGYVVGVDVITLQQQAEKANVHIIVATRPGEVADRTTPIAYITPAQAADGNLLQLVENSIALDTKRHPEEDMRYNLLNLAETADRALSPSINDPGTAINIMNIQMQILARWAEIHSQGDCFNVVHDRISVLPITAEELVNDSFTPIARDGASIVEVGVRLQKILQALMRIGDEDLTEAAQNMSKTALELANKALISGEHRHRVSKAATTLGPRFLPRG